MPQLLKYHNAVYRLSAAGPSGDYRVQHRAPRNDGYHSPMWDLAGFYPDDIYSPEGKRLYGDHTACDSISIAVINAARNQRQAGASLFHTTSFSSLQSIIKEQELKPNSFISFSQSPFSGDISANEVVLMLDKTALLPYVEEVKYSEKWYDQHRAQAAYIAGEGWVEQYLPPEDCFYFDEEAEEEFEDEECTEAAYREAELESFLFKADEREWISKLEWQPMPLPVSAIKRIILLKPNNKIVPWLRRNGLQIPVAVKK